MLSHFHYDSHKGQRSVLKIVIRSASDQGNVQVDEFLCKKE